MKKYIIHPTQWVVTNKIRSMMNKEVNFNNIPCFNVGQDPLQGDLDYNRMIPFTDTRGTKPDSSQPLIEV